MPLRLWFQANPASPQWPPAFRRHPLLGYLIALLLEVLVAGLTFVSVHSLPIFAEVFAGVCIAMFLLIGLSISLAIGQGREKSRQTEEIITSLQEAYAKAERERLRLRTLLDALPAAVGMMDTQARLVEINPANKALWGEGTPSPGEVAQVQTWRGWWPDTGKPLRPDEWAITRALTRGETTINQEVEVETSSGQHKVILDSAVPIRDAHGVILGGAGIHQDITERKRLEEALRTSERRAAEHARELEVIFEAVTDGLFVYDREGRILRYNTAARQLFRFDARPDVVSLPFRERAIHYDSLDERGQPFPIEQLALSRVLQGEVLTSSQATDERLHALDGRELAVSITGAPLRDADGGIMGAVAIVRDVTEQRRLEQHTHETLNALLLMAEALVQTPGQAPDLPTDTTPPVDQVAQRLAELTRSVLGCQRVSMAAIEPATGALTPVTVVGLSPESEQQWWEGWSQRPNIGAGLQPAAFATLCAGQPVLLEGTHSPLPVWKCMTPEHQALLVPMRVGETLVGVLRVECSTVGERYTDPNKQALVRAVARLGALVLERERLLREREEARVRELALQETNMQMDTFLGMAGHELKTPMTSLKLALQLTGRRLRRPRWREMGEAPDLAPVLEQVALGVRQADRLDRLVSDLLDVSRIRAGKLELHLEATDLAAILSEAAEEQRRAMPGRVISLHLPPNERPLLVTADTDRIGQVVTNYLTNALKYSSADLPVEVGLTTNGEQARVWVRDQGPGLPAEEQERIWERFHRAKGIEAQGGGGVGLGLGLYICRMIIERHHGQVGVESAPGQGSTFWFTLPLAC